MNEDKILRQNKIPGCERLTRPEEIAALSKYLKKIKETYDEHTELERDELEIPGRTTGQIKEVKELGTDSIKLKTNKNSVGLSEYIERLTDSNKINLNNDSAKLNVSEETKTLNNNLEKLKVSDEVSLNNDSAKLNVSEETETLNNNLEKLKVSDEVSLNNNKENLKIDDNIELADKLVILNSKTGTELSNNKINLDISKNKIELETESIELEDNRKSLELNDKKENLLDYRKDINLSDYRENFTDDRKEKLADKKEIIFDKRQESLSNYKDSFLDDRKTNLSNYKENINPNEIKKLSSYKEIFTDNRDINLEDEAIKLNNISDLPLSDFKDILVNGDFKEVELEDEVINRPPNSSSDAGNDHNFIDPNNASLSDTLIAITSEDPQDDAGNDHSFIDPNNASLENKILNLGPEDPQDDAGNDHSFIDPNNATLEDKIISLVSNDSENITFINPNDAHLEDEVINRPSNSSSDAGNDHNFIDPNNANLENEVVNLGDTSYRDAVSDSEHPYNYWDNTLDSSEANLKYTEEDKISRPDTSSRDARFSGGGYEYIDDTSPYIDNEVVDGHRKKLLRPNTSTLDARLDELYQYKDNLTDHQLYEEVIKLLESIGNDHEYDNISSTSENFHKMTGIVGSASWVQKLESLVSAYLSGDNKISPKNAHMFEDALYNSFIPEARYDSDYNFIDNNTTSEESYNVHKQRINNTKEKIYRPRTNPDSDARLLDNEYQYIRDNITDASSIPVNEKIEARRVIIERPTNNPDNDARNEDSSDYNYWDKESENSQFIYSKNIKRPFTENKENARLDNSYDYIKNNSDEIKNVDGSSDSINVDGNDPYNVNARNKVKNHKDRLNRPENNPDNDARDGNNSDYNYWDKEDKNNQLKNYKKISIEDYLQETPADKFEKHDNKIYKQNQARINVPDYSLSDLLVDSIQNGSYTNFNFNNTDSYLNFLKDVRNSDVSISRYIRWAAEKACKSIPGGSTTRKLLLEETLAALVFARDYIERQTKSNRDRLPGDEKWYSSLLNGGVGEFVNNSKNWLYGKLGIINDPKKQEPLNRPKPEKSSADVNSAVSSAISMAINLGGGISNQELVDSLTDNALTDKYQAEVSHRPDIQGNISTELSFSENYLGGFGLFTTLKDLCESSRTKIHSLYDLKSALKDAPYITTPDKFGSIRKNGESKFGSYSLDTNAYWEIILEPLCYKPLNGGISFLPSIQEINVMNKLQHGVLTAYNKWIPFTSFDLQKSKMVGKSLSLFDGEINYPSSVELTNELRLTIVDDEFKSWRQYFQKCMDVSVYNSTSHDRDFYGKTKDELLRNLEELTIVDKDYICISFYKNIAFNIQIYLMNPQYSTIRSYNLLCVLKDFSEDYNGDTEGGAQDLNLTFSVVGELNFSIPDYQNSLNPIQGNINSNFPDQLPPTDYLSGNRPFYQQTDYKDTSGILEGTLLNFLDLGFVGWIPFNIN